MGSSCSASNITPARLAIGDEVSSYTNAEVSAEFQWVEASFIAEIRKIYIFIS